MINKLRLVTLDRFNRTCFDPLAQKLFMGMITLRAEGYGPDYPDSYIPYDAADFFCWHHLICEERPDGELHPIAGFRQVAVSRCDYHRVTLPLFQSALASGSQPHIRALERVLARHRAQQTECVHGGGLTIRKSVRADRQFSLLFRELSAALTYCDFRERGVRSNITGAVIRFKTHLWFQNVGFVALADGEEPLPPLKKVSADGEPMLLMEATEPSAWAQECFERHRALFERRLILAPDEKTGKAAA